MGSPAATSVCASDQSGDYDRARVTYRLNVDVRLEDFAWESHPDRT
jgi:hypothetical protein